MNRKQKKECLGIRNKTFKVHDVLLSYYALSAELRKFNYQYEATMDRKMSIFRILNIFIYLKYILEPILRNSAAR